MVGKLVRTRERARKIRPSFNGRTPALPRPSVGRRDGGDSDIIRYTVYNLQYNVVANGHNKLCAFSCYIPSPIKQVALMDEDHSGMQAPSSVASSTTTRVVVPSLHGTPSTSRLPSPLSTPSRHSIGLTRDRGWSSTGPVSPTSRTYTRRGSFSLPAESNFATTVATGNRSIERNSRGAAALWAGGVGGGDRGYGLDEMSCVDVADLGDVVGVYQEEEAPEQVSIGGFRNNCGN